MNKNNPNIYVADIIDECGILTLKSSGYNIIPLYHLDNSDLINKISVLEEKSNTPSALIIRSVRKLDKIDLKRIHEDTKIKFISTASSGYDNIDHLYARKLGFKVINVPDGNYISAAEHTIALILCIFKNLNNYSSIFRRKDFLVSSFANKELYNKSIGIIGVGRVGLYLARLCRSFNMKIYGNDIKRGLARRYPWITFCSLKVMASKCDIVTVHTPLDSSTINLVDDNLINSMKKGVILINCARGGIINEQALIKNLLTGKIFYAGLDVFENEPDINKGFKHLKNIVLTPHQAGKTTESRKRISSMLAVRLMDEFERFFVNRKKPKLKN